MCAWVTVWVTVIQCNPKLLHIFSTFGVCKTNHKIARNLMIIKLRKNMDIEIFNQLNRIEHYCLLAAKKVLNFSDVALLTGLSKSHLYKLTCEHRIPYYKPNGKHIYFDRAEIEDWMKQNRVATDQEINQKASNYMVTKS